MTQGRKPTRRFDLIHLCQLTRSLGPAVSTQLMNTSRRKKVECKPEACCDQFTLRLIVVVPDTVPDVAVTVMV